jgi:hypothetical protein
MIIRRPQNPTGFSGTIVAEAQHAGGRSLIFEWSRVSILTRNHIFAEIVHSPNNIQQLKTFNADRYASLNIAMGQTNEIIAQFGRWLKAGIALAEYNVRRLTLMAPPRRARPFGIISASTPICGCPTARQGSGESRQRSGGGREANLRRLLAHEHARQTPLPVVDALIAQMPTRPKSRQCRGTATAIETDSDAPAIGSGG